VTLPSTSTDRPIVRVNLRSDEAAHASESAPRTVISAFAPGAGALEPEPGHVNVAPQRDPLPRRIRRVGPAVEAAIANDTASAHDGTRDAEPTWSIWKVGWLRRRTEARQLQRSSDQPPPECASLKWPHLEP
jgi:hypothetical protein